MLGEIGGTGDKSQDRCPCRRTRRGPCRMVSWSRQSPWRAFAFGKSWRVCVDREEREVIKSNNFVRLADRQNKRIRAWVAT